MRKKKAESQSKPQPEILSIADIGQKLSDSLVIRDQAFDRFWNYKPIPKLMQDDSFFTSPKKTCVILGANKCISGTTKIYDPTIQAYRVVQDTTSEFSVLAWNGHTLVPARASRPFVKAFEHMYQVTFSNGESLRCTAEHRIMSRRGEYQPLKELKVGTSVFQPVSTVDIYQQVHTKDGTSLKRIVPDSQAHYSSDHHPYDGQPPYPSKTVEDDSPSLGGGKEHNASCCNWRHLPLENVAYLRLYIQGAMARISQHIHSGLRALRLSIVDFCFPALGRLYDSIRSQKTLITNTIFSETMMFSPSSAFELGHLKQTIPAIRDQHSYVPPVNNDTTTFQETIITSITPVGKEIVWDITVEKYHNYYAGGVINRNSTKTTAAVFKAVMIFCGIVPPSMQGVWPHEKELRDIAPGGKKHRPRQVRIVVQDYTKHFPETIRPLLFSSSEGMLPEAWANYDDKEHIFHGPDGSYLSIIAINPRENIDPNILRGPLIDHTLIDELNHESVFSESLARGVALKDGPRTVDMVYCPQEGYECWTYEMFYKAGYDQNTRQRLPPARRHKSISVIKLTMRDNPSISEEQITAITSTLRPWEVAFRVEGEYSHRSSNNYFDMETLDKWEREGWVDDGGKPYRIREKKIDEDAGIFEGELKLATGDIDETTEPIWRVWELPQDRQKYVISADLSEGNPNSDPHCASVWKCTDDRHPYQVAQLRIRNCRPSTIAAQCAMMGKAYGGYGRYSYALLVPERNSTGGGQFIERIRNYANLYKRVRGLKQNEEQTEVVGWYTDASTKGPILSDLYKALQQFGADKYEQAPGKDEWKSWCPVRSKYTLHELMGFEERIKKTLSGQTKVEWGGRTGAHDDCVIEMAIAFRIIIHEYAKITTCNLNAPAVTMNFTDNHVFDKGPTGGKAFGAMKEQKSLVELRRNLYRRI